MGHKNFLTKANGRSSLLRAAGRSEWTREKNGSLLFGISRDIMTAFWYPSNEVIQSLF
jgi:hypothetical protein